MSDYLPRIVDETIKQRLKTMGALLIEGPKWCGKTTTAEQFSKSRLYLADPTKIKQYQLIGDTDTKILLEGEKPRLVDEWQIAPKLWDAIRFDVDHVNKTGGYILTGSSTPQNKEAIFHSGTGRFAWIRMRPMSLYESKDSSGKVSLKHMFTTPKSITAESAPIDIRRLAFLTCRGGWPRTKEIPEKDSLQVAFEYVNALIKTDLSSENSGKKSERYYKLLRALARNQGEQATQETLIADMGEDITSPNTLRSDLAELKRLFVTEDALAWNPNLRSKTAIRTSETRYFADPSIATATLGVGPDDLIADIDTFGLVFETLCFRDLRVYTEQLNGNVYHYRDKNGLECDAVIHLHNGKYGLVEIKLGGDESIEYGATKLKEFKNKIDTNRMQEPSFLMVLVGMGSYAYRREDGVYVVPVGSLKP